MDDNIRKLTFDEEVLLESAEKRFENGDFLGALTMLNKRAELYPPSADSAALYADIYEALEIWPLCADAWFRFLDTCNEADFAEGYEGLAIAFMNMGEEFQSELYYHRLTGGEMSGFEPKPRLRLVHSADAPVDGELLFRAVEHIKRGELAKAREALLEIGPESKDHPSASGLIAMCLLLEGDTDGAAKECERLLGYYPDNIHALTTYCAVLGAQGKTDEAREVGRKLSTLKAETAEDLFRVSTALCETGLDEEAYEKLSLLKTKIPYGDDVLWFHAVAAQRTGRTEEAISSLERLTTVYPRKVIAKYYLSRLRRKLDGAEDDLVLNYFYRVPDDVYNSVLSFMLTVKSLRGDEADDFIATPEFKDYFRIAFDQLDGRDEKLQLLAVHVAERSKQDEFLREILLDHNVDEGIKFHILCDLICRNEDNSFGVVICSLYREFFIHKIEIGTRKRKPFLRAFAEVYSRYGFLGEENENKIIGAAEDVYRILEEAEVLDLAEEREALATVIFREARLEQCDRSLEEMCAHFNAKPSLVKEILDYII